jgi:hypothetical protein
MSLTTLNEKYGIALDGVLIAGIVVGIALVSAPIVTAVGLVAGVVGAVQVSIVRNETVSI